MIMNDKQKTRICARSVALYQTYDWWSGPGETTYTVLVSVGGVPFNLNYESKEVLTKDLKKLDKLTKIDKI